MKNYIVIASFDEAEQTKRFYNDLKNNFTENKLEEYEGFHYFAFPERDDPAVQDKLNDLLHSYGIGNKDYVALYYSRPQAPDEINRNMIIGHDELIESQLKEVPIEKHQNTLIDLMNYDFLKARHN